MSSRKASPSWSVRPDTSTCDVAATTRACACASIAALPSMVRTAIIWLCEARDVIDPSSVVHGFHGWPLGLILLLSCFALVGVRRLRAATDSHKRGAVISNRDHRFRRRRRAHRHSAKRALQLADLTIPPHDETKHFKIVGTTGTVSQRRSARFLRARCGVAIGP